MLQDLAARGNVKAAEMLLKLQDIQETAKRPAGAIAWLDKLDDDGNPLKALSPKASADTA
jgi:hypothetical protein